LGLSQRCGDDRQAEHAHANPAEPLHIAAAYSRGEAQQLAGSTLEARSCQKSAAGTKRA
jgi:hypothetical protein